MSVAETLRTHVFADDAPDQLATYLNSGQFSGAWFDLLAGPGEAPDRFTPRDLVAVSTLGVAISGWTTIELLDLRAPELSRRLAHLPTDLDLHEATDEHLKAVYRARDALDTVRDLGPAIASKLLACKRPRLVPNRDRHVLTALTGRPHGPFTELLRDSLRQNPELREHLVVLSRKVGREDLSLLRVLDIVVWMRAHGARSIAVA